MLVCFPESLDRVKQGLICVRVQCDTLLIAYLSHVTLYSFSHLASLFVKNSCCKHHHHHHVQFFFCISQNVHSPVQNVIYNWCELVWVNNSLTVCNGHQNKDGYRNPVRTSHLSGFNKDGKIR